MNVLLISANRTEINMRTMPLGLACVADAARRDGHKVTVLDLVRTGDVGSALADAVEAASPGAIGISIRNIDDQVRRETTFFFADDNRVISLARRVSGAPIILGGAGYSMYPQAILEASEAYMGIEGEGEAVLPILLRRLETGGRLDDVPGLHVKGRSRGAPRAFITDPDAHPLPSPDLLLASAGATSNLWVPVQTRRGCAMRCSYCSTGAIEGTILRKRSPAAVARWLSGLRDRGVEQFYFVDNTFNLPPSYASALCRGITEASLNIRWRCILYPHRLDEELVEGMARAGCVEVSLGFESGNDRVLQGMNKRFRKADVAQASALLKRYGITQTGFLLLGGPDETLESAEESLAFADSLDLEFLRAGVGIRIYPGTAIAERARVEGMIAPDDDLLQPQFYVRPQLEDAIGEAVKRYAAKRPNWII